MTRTTKVLGFSVPPAVAKEVERIAKSERRTKSELFREMVRVYRRYRVQQERDELRWVTNLIEETKAEEARKPMTVAESLTESERLVHYGEKQAKKVGIKPGDINRIIHERRKTRRS